MSRARSKIEIPLKIEIYLHITCNLCQDANTLLERSLIRIRRKLSNSHKRFFKIQDQRRQQFQRQSNDIFAKMPPKDKKGNNLFSNAL
jgi:hypothetical protein